MKTKTLILSICVLIIYTNSKAQKYPFEIPKGTRLYTTKPNNFSGIKPYNRKAFERYNSEKVKIIETGDFLIQEREENNQIAFDTIGFEERVIKITGKDTIVTKKIKAFQRSTIYPIKCNIVFKEDKILIFPSPLYKSVEYQVMNYPDGFIHHNDQNLHFHLDTNSEFLFYKESVAAGIISSPFRIRLSSSSDDLGIEGESKFNNINLLLGYRKTKFQYNHGKLKESSFSIGPFAGLSLIQLNTENSDIPNNSSVNKLGINMGLALLKEIKHVSVGIAFGTELIDREVSFNWKHRNKIYFGFSVGVHL